MSQKSRSKPDKIEENIKNKKQKSIKQTLERKEKMNKDRCWFFEKVMKLIKLQEQNESKQR